AAEPACAQAPHPPPVAGLGHPPPLPVRPWCGQDPDGIHPAVLNLRRLLHYASVRGGADLKSALTGALQTLTVLVKVVDENPDHEPLQPPVVGDKPSQWRKGRSGKTGYCFVSR